MIIVDSSVIVSGLRANDANHQIAKDWFQENLSKELGIPEIALCEIAGALARQKEPPETIDRAIAFVQKNFALIEVDMLVVNEGVRLAKICCLRGADSIFAAVTSLEEGNSLVTFDAELAERPSGVITTVNLNA